MTIDEKLRLVAAAVGFSERDKRIVKKAGKTFVPVLFNNLPFKFYERGDENLNLDVNFFNPVTEMTLRGDSPALSLLKNQVSTLISRNAMMIVLTALQIINKDGSSIKLSALFPKVKITTRHASAFKRYIEFLSMSGIQAYTLNVKNHPKVEDVKHLAGASVTSNALTKLDKLTSEELEELEFKEGYVDIFKYALSRVFKEQFYATSNNKKYSTFDSVAKGFNVFVANSNRMVKHFKDVKPATYKALWLDKMLIADDFDDDMLDLKRIPLFKDARYGNIEEEEEETVETATTTDGDMDELSFDITPDISTKPVPVVSAQEQAQTIKPAVQENVLSVNQQTTINSQARNTQIQKTTDVSSEVFEYSAFPTASNMTLNGQNNNMTMGTQATLTMNNQPAATTLTMNGAQTNGMTLNGQQPNTQTAIQQLLLQQAEINKMLIAQQQQTQQPMANTLMQQQPNTILGQQTTLTNNIDMGGDLPLDTGFFNPN